MVASGATPDSGSRRPMRSRSSEAALRLKVRISTWSGRSAARSGSVLEMTASTSVCVFPVPGPASTSSGPPG